MSVQSGSPHDDAAAIRDAAEAICNAKNGEAIGTKQLVLTTGKGLEFRDLTWTEKLLGASKITDLVTIDDYCVKERINVDTPEYRVLVDAYLANVKQEKPKEAAHIQALLSKRTTSAKKEELKERLEHIQKMFDELDLSSARAAFKRLANEAQDNRITFDDENTCKALATKLLSKITYHEGRADLQKDIQILFPKTSKLLIEADTQERALKAAHDLSTSKLLKGDTPWSEFKNYNWQESNPSDPFDSKVVPIGSKESEILRYFMVKLNGTPDKDIPKLVAELGDAKEGVLLHLCGNFEQNKELITKFRRGMTGDERLKFADKIWKYQTQLQNHSIAIYDKYKATCGYRIEWTEIDGLFKTLGCDAILSYAKSFGDDQRRHILG